MDPIEGLRSTVRRILPQWLYGRLSRLLDATWIIVREGWSNYEILRNEDPGSKGFQEIRLRRIPYPIRIRRGTPDASCIIQNLIRSEYGRLTPPAAPRIIIDAGAYIGDVSIFFLNRFPTAKVIALEPSPDNYAVARVNLAPYSSRAVLLNRGLWHRRGRMAVAGHFVGAHLQESETASTEVACVDVDSLLLEFSIDHIDILKMDIEGAEDEVLSLGSASWLQKTDYLIVEFHRQDVAFRCTKLLESRGFRGFQSRSLRYFSRNGGRIAG